MEFLNQVQRAYNTLLNNDKLGRYGAGNIDLYKRPQYDHLIKADNKDVYDYVIERLDNGKNIYKMTDRLNKKKK